MPTPFSASKLLSDLPRLRRYARVLTGDAERADRIVEETLARARKLDDESLSGSADSIRLLALLRSVYADQIAPSPAGQTQVLGPLMQLHSKAAEDSNASVGQSPRGAEMLAQLLHLPLEQREVVVLVAVERMSYADIAALLSIPAATVIARLSQAREGLRSTPSMPQSTPKNAN